MPDLTDLEKRLRERYTAIRPCVVGAAPEACNAFFVVDNQSFNINPLACDDLNRAEAEVYCDLLARALARIVEAETADATSENAKLRRVLAHAQLMERATDASEQVAWRQVHCLRARVEELERERDAARTALETARSWITDEQRQSESRGYPCMLIDEIDAVLSGDAESKEGK